MRKTPKTQMLLKRKFPCFIYVCCCFCCYVVSFLVVRSFGDGNIFTSPKALPMDIFGTQGTGSTFDMEFLRISTFLGDEHFQLGNNLGEYIFLRIYHYGRQSVVHHYTNLCLCVNMVVFPVWAQIALVKGSTLVMPIEL